MSQTAGETTGVQYREISWKDLVTFDRVVLQGIGNLERATGLDELAVDQFKVLHRRTIWTLFKVLRVLGRPPIRVFVGADDSGVLGTASVFMLPKSAYVVGVATDSRARNRGIATHLMEMIHAQARREGKGWFALDTESENETAIRVYRKLRYEVVMEYGWYVGPVPPEPPNPGGANPVQRSELNGLADWVNGNSPDLVRDSLPATAKRLSYLEILLAGPRNPVKTWRLSSNGQTEAVARVIYSSAIKTGFLLPFVSDAHPASEPLASLLTPAIGWVRSLGGARIVAPVPLQSKVLGQALEAFNLTRKASTVLMIRPSLEKPGQESLSGSEKGESVAHQ